MHKVVMVLLVGMALLGDDISAGEVSDSTGNWTISECRSTIPPTASDQQVESLYRRCVRSTDMKLYTELRAHEAWSLENRKHAFEWQHRYTLASTVAVFALVSVGAILAVLEFRKGKNDATSLKVSKEGVEVNSSVIGLLVLALSLVFFYLYVERIYAIRILSDQKIERADTSQKQ